MSMKFDLTEHRQAHAAADAAITVDGLGPATASRLANRYGRALDRIEELERQLAEEQGPTVDELLDADPGA